MEPIDQINTFCRRLSRIGIDVKLAANYPWIYLTHINGKAVTETFQGNHGFTVAFYPIRKGVNEVQWTDLSMTFDIIRWYATPE
jgi:hypothetical protein